MGSTTRPLISLEQYLATSFPGVDQEYIYGELRPKAMPDRFHSEIQLSMGMALKSALRPHGVKVGTEIRCRLAPEVVLVPDIGVFQSDQEFEAVPTAPLLVAVEVVSGDDKYWELLDKLTHYRSWGVPHIWVVDPWRRQLSRFVTQGLVDVPALELPEYGFRITLDELTEGLPLPLGRRG